MKLFLRLFLSFCLFLFGMQVPLHASACEANTAFSFKGKVNAEASLSVTSLLGDVVLGNKFLPFRITNDKIDVGDSEDEDEELMLFKKYTQVNNYFATFFEVKTPAYFCNYIKECLLFGKHFSYASYHRYIVFRAIRV